MRKQKGIFDVPENIFDDYNSAVKMMELGGDQRPPREIFERLLEKEPDHPKLLLALGLTYFHEKQHKKAEEIFLKALELYRGNPEVYAHLSFVYSSAGRFDESFKYAEMAIEGAPESPFSWNAMGMHYTRARKYEMALGNFIAACTLDPEHYLSFFNAACIYAVIGKTKKSLEYLKTALKSDRFVYLAETDEDLASVRKMREFKALLSETWRKLKIE